MGTVVVSSSGERVVGRVRNGVEEPCRRRKRSSASFTWSACVQITPCGPPSTTTSRCLHCRVQRSAGRERKSRSASPWTIKIERRWSRGPRGNRSARRRRTGRPSATPSRRPRGCLDQLRPDRVGGQRIDVAEVEKKGREVAGTIRDEASRIASKTAASRPAGSSAVFGRNGGSEPIKTAHDTRREP